MSVKFYAEVLPKDMGRVMYRINSNMKKYAPGWASFVTDPTKADVQILDIIGTGSLAYQCIDHPVILQHCYRSSETSDPNVWVPVFKNARLVASYMDIYALSGSTDFNFIRIPWGVDPNIFYETDEKDVILVLSTGYVSSTESIKEAYVAARRLNGNLVNVGEDFRFGAGFRVFEGISDEELRRLYSKAKYTIGLRKIEGFELPIIEGLLCGSRGICYNADHYKYWYGDLVEYVEEDPQSLYGAPYSTNVEDRLYEIFSSPYRTVTPEEKKRVIDTFSWDSIFSKFWKEVEKVV